MDYRHLPAAEFHALLMDPLYAGTGLNHGKIAKLMGQLLRAEVADLTNGDVMICSQDNLQKGYCLEVQMFLSDYHCKLKFLVEAFVIHFAPEMKEMVFSAGVKVLAVKKDDLELLDRIIEKQKGH